MSDRRYPPTQAKLEELRSEGKVPVSKIISHSGALIFSFSLLVLFLLTNIDGIFSAENLESNSLLWYRNLLDLALFSLVVGFGAYIIGYLFCHLLQTRFLLLPSQLSWTFDRPTRSQLQRVRGKTISLICGCLAIAVVGASFYYFASWCAHYQFSGLSNDVALDTLLTLFMELAWIPFVFWFVASLFIWLLTRLRFNRFYAMTARELLEAGE